MDGGAATRIAALAVGDGDLPVVEVGPGTGALSRALIQLGAKPTLIEIDPDMVAVLRDDERYVGLKIVQGDALEYPYEDIAASGDWVATGNLPYNVGTLLVMRWVEAEHPPRRIVVMLQRDVADRLTALHNTAEYGSVSVSAQLTMTVKRAFTLGPQVFYPRPKVDSAVVVLERRAEPLVPREHLAMTREVARAAFAYRRKTLANSLVLARGYDRERINAALAELGLDPNVRGETLPVTVFGKLAEKLIKR